jgi:purine nucleosidase
VSDPIPLLLDTDIGTNIDDALALAYLLVQRRCELLGITTVTGAPDERARLADAVCRAAGRDDVPIHAGANVPRVIEPEQITVPLAGVLPRWPHRRVFPAETAVDFLRETIRARPGEITLLAIGPLTNVAELFERDPEIPRLLGRLVTMGGVFDGPDGDLGSPETNTRLDPHATDVVFRAGAAGHTCIGLNVTSRCRLSRDTCRQRLRGGVLDCIADMAELWFAERDAITFHDPLAAACVFVPDLCRYAGGRVDVRLDHAVVEGVTEFRAASDGPHAVAIDVDVDRFFAHYFNETSPAATSPVWPTR